MRSYRLVISNADAQVYVPNSQGGFDLKPPGSNVSTFTSQVPALMGTGTVNDPGALDIEFDAPLALSHDPKGKIMITVHGVGIQMIYRGADLNGQYFKLYAGMAAGLPIATAQAGQFGLILKGQIFQSFGNWLGTDQTLNLICNPGTIYDGEVVGLAPANGISFSWSPGQSLSSAMVSALTQAYPGFIINAPRISANLQCASDYPQFATYGSLQPFATYIKTMTATIGQVFTPDGQPPYEGVDIMVSGDTFDIFDNSHVTPTTLNFYDLIGQPTWINFNEITFQTILRADLSIGDLIVFPAASVSIFANVAPDAATPNTPFRNKTIFQNEFAIRDVHHYAHFRQADAQSWNTTFIARLITPDITVEDPFNALPNG